MDMIDIGERIRDDKLEMDIKEYFLSWGYVIIEYDRLLHYFENNYLIKNYDTILKENICYWEIKCPMDFLDCDAIVESDNDFMPVGYGLYLNRYLLEECGYFEELVESDIVRKTD